MDCSSGSSRSIPAPPARSAYAVRRLTLILVMFPQILIGMRITFDSTALYSYYDLCGRLFPSISAPHDQHLGGLIVWIPSSMMSSITFMRIMNNIRLQEDKTCDRNGQDDITAGDGVVVSSGELDGTLRKGGAGCSRCFSPSLSSR
jgi:putative membrane protein